LPEFVAERYLLLDAEPPRPGGMSTVRKAVDARTGEFVAVKYPKDEHSDSFTRKIFEREVATLRTLDHPNIIRLLDAGVDPEGRFFLVLDWYEQSLKNALEQYGAYEWPVLEERIAMPVAAALAHAHLKGVEHRDIKPDNVLLTKEEAPRLADFGIGKIRGGGGTASELTVRVFRSGVFAPPELDGSTPYVRDVYSFGVLLVRALCGAPFEDYAEMTAALSAVRVPPDVRRLLDRCVHIDPTVRPANGSMLLDELRDLATEQDQRRSVRASTVWLKLTQSARRQLVTDGADPEVAEGRLVADLTTTAVAEFHLDGETGRRDRSKLMLCGERFRYTLLHHRETGAMNVVGAKEAEYDLLDAARRRGMETAGQFAWTTTRPMSVATATADAAVLLHGLDDFYAKQDVHPGGDPTADDGDELFDGWLRLLQAREELARGERSPLPYVTVRIRKRDAEFTLAEPPDADLLGTEWRIMTADNRQRLFEGEVIAHRDESVVVRPRGSRGRIPERGVLVPHLGASQVAIQRETDAVVAVKDRTAARPDLRDVLVNPAFARPPGEVPEPAWRQELDPDKRSAVRAGLGVEDILLVKGPPGTGKTSFITELVGQLLDTDPDARVLIVSQTHVAVDNALERLERLGVQGLVRLGGTDDPRVSPATRHLVHDRQMARWAETVGQRAAGHMAERAEAAGISPRHLRAAMSLQRLAAVLEEMGRVEEYVARIDAEGGESKLGTDLGAENAGDLRQRLEELREQQGELLQHARAELGGDLALPERPTLPAVQGAVDALLGHGAAARGLFRLLHLQAEWLQRVTSDRNLAGAFLKTTRVVAGTCVGFLRHPAVRTLDIDLCVLDEASKATATEALVPMARARRTVLVGDTHQLPPLDEELLRRRDLLDEFGLDPDFVTETLFQRLANRLPSWGQRELKEQYRMIRPIGDLISMCFYDGALQSPRTEGLAGYEQLSKPVLWLDTKPLGERRREDAGGDGGHSFANRTEAEVVVDRLRAIDGAVANGVLRIPEDRARLEVLVIAPYRSQVEELRRRLAFLRPKHLDCEVQSVDAVQGREADLTVFSVTRSNAAGRFGFLGNAYWRRINVALSRARFGLTIVGDAEFCRSAPGALRLVLDHIKTHPEACELRAVSRVR
jgi:hypothetical protein